MKGESSKSSKVVTQSSSTKDAIIVHKPFVELDGKLVEQGYDGKNVYFLVYDLETQLVTNAPMISSVEGKSSFQYYPILNDLVKNGQVSFPSEALEYENEKTLLQEITDFIDRWYEELDQNQLLIDTLYVLFTYISDLVPISPYLRKYGKYGKGKSTFLKVVGGICHRAFHVAGCSTEAALRRTFDAIRGTALMDEADFSHSDLYTPIMKILNIGHDKAIGWYNCCDEKDSRDILGFNVYCPKVLVTRERWKDMALESRCINSQSKENKSARPLYQTKKFDEEKQQIINKLQMWRFRNYNLIKERIGSIEDRDIVKNIFGEDFDVPGRIKQIMVPLSLIVQDNGVKSQLKQLMVQQNETLQSMDPEIGLEQDIRKALAKLLLQGLENKTELTKLTKLITHKSPITFIIKNISQTILQVSDDNPDEFKNELKGLSRKITNYFRDRWELKTHGGTGNKTVVEIPIDKLLSILKIVGAKGSLTSLLSLTVTDILFWTRGALKQFVADDRDEKQNEESMTIKVA